MSSWTNHLGVATIIEFLMRFLVYSYSSMILANDLWVVTDPENYWLENPVTGTFHLEKSSQLKGMNMFIFIFKIFFGIWDF